MERTISITVPEKAKLSWLQAVIRKINPKDERFYELLEKQADISRRAAGKLQELIARDVTQVMEEVQELEHEGDKVVHMVEHLLASTFVTPLDREDIQQLCTKLDDVLDFTNAAVRSCWMRGVLKPTAPMVEMIDLLVKMTAELNEALRGFRTHDFEPLKEKCRLVRQMESYADKHFRKAIYDLYHAETPDLLRILREESVLKDLEKALNSAEDLADVIINLAVKHG